MASTTKTAAGSMITIEREPGTDATTISVAVAPPIPCGIYRDGGLTTRVVTDLPVSAVLKRGSRAVLCMVLTQTSSIGDYGDAIGTMLRG